MNDDAEREAAELGLTLPPGYVRPDESIKSNDTLTAERLATATVADRTAEALRVRAAQREEHRRLRALDRQVGEALGWHGPYTVEMVDWGDGHYAYDPNGQHRPLPRFSEGGRDTLELVKRFGLSLIAPSPKSPDADGRTKWRAGIILHDRTSVNCAITFDWLAGKHESLAEAICQYVLITTVTAHAER